MQVNDFKSIKETIKYEVLQKDQLVTIFLDLLNQKEILIHSDRVLWLEMMKR